MKSQQANELIEQIRVKYSPRYDITDIDMLSWRKYLITINYQEATAAIERMFCCEMDTYGAMPNINVLKNNVGKAVENNCPCCNGSGWLSWVVREDPRFTFKSSHRGKPNDMVSKCHCMTGKPKDKVPGLCENTYCQNPGKVDRLIVPAGWYDRMKPMMASCIYKSSVTESNQWGKPKEAKQLLSELSKSVG